MDSFRMDYEYYVIDAFSSEPGSGNPAAVVLDARGMTDRQMQEIAAAFGHSETTFVLPAAARQAIGRGGGTSTGDAHLSVRFRWFTPVTEVDLCGHATIAGLQALFESGRLDDWRDDPAVHVRIEARIGDLFASVEKVPGAEARMNWLSLPPPGLTAFRVDLPALAMALGEGQVPFSPRPPAARTRDGDVIVFVRDVPVLNALTPDFSELSGLLGRWKARGLLVSTTATLTPSVQVQSRFFAPNFGVNEDPVTGSVTGPLAAHLVQEGVVGLEDGRAAIVCLQGKPGGRTGMVYALVKKDERGGLVTNIGGRAVVTETGRLRGSGGSWRAPGPLPKRI